MKPVTPALAPVRPRVRARESAFRLLEEVFEEYAYDHSAGILWIAGMAGAGKSAAITSNPGAARFAVRNEKGQTVATGVTPAKVSLKRGNGFFRKAPRYVAIIEKPGFEPARVPINPKVNPWIAGNLVLGGVIGLAADSATGAIWKFTPTEIEQKLTPYGDDQYSQTDGGEVAQATHIAEQPSRNDEAGKERITR